MDNSIMDKLFWKEQTLSLLLSDVAAQNFEFSSPEPPTTLRVPPYYKDLEGNRKAVANLEFDTSAAWALALLWVLTKNSRFATKAVEYIDSWAFNCRNWSGQEAALNLCYKGIMFMESWGVLSRTGYSWNSVPSLVWFKFVLSGAADYILTRQSNNQAAWAIATKALLENLSPEHNMGKIAELFQLHLKQAFDPVSGLPWHEVKRHNSGLRYTYFELAPDFRTAQILAANGFSFFEELEAPFEFFWRWCQDPEAWPWRKSSGILGSIQNFFWPGADELLKPLPNGWGANLLEMAAPVFNRPDWESWLQRPVWGGVNLFKYATLLRAWSVPLV